MFPAECVCVCVRARVCVCACVHAAGCLPGRLVPCKLHFHLEMQCLQDHLPGGKLALGVREGAGVWLVLLKLRPQQEQVCSCPQGAHTGCPHMVRLRAGQMGRTPVIGLGARGSLQGFPSPVCWVSIPAGS